MFSGLYAKLFLCFHSQQLLNWHPDQLLTTQTDVHPKDLCLFFDDVSDEFRNCFPLNFGQLAVLWVPHVNKCSCNTFIWALHWKQPCMAFHKISLFKCKFGREHQLSIFTDWFQFQRKSWGLVDFVTYSWSCFLWIMQPLVWKGKKLLLCLGTLPASIINSFDFCCPRPDYDFSKECPEASFFSQCWQDNK